MSAGLPGYPGLPGPPGPADTLGVAASQAANLNWWSMASQLAAQDYLTRVQAAAREPSQYPGLQQAPYSDLLAPGSKPRREQEASKSGAGSRPGEQSGSGTSRAGEQAGSGTASSGNASPGLPSIPNIPAGLTIEKKKPGRKPLDPHYHVPSSGHAVDRVEITKIPLNNGSPAPLDMTSRAAQPDNSQQQEDAPLNLSMRSEGEQAGEKAEPLSLTAKGKERGQEGEAPAHLPADYYACKYPPRLCRTLVVIFCSTSAERSVPGRANPAAAARLGAAVPPAGRHQPLRHAGPPQPWHRPRKRGSQR